MSHPPRTTIRPIFGSLTEIGSQWIAFYVSKYAQQVVVLLDRKRLETSLVEMPGALRLVVGIMTMSLALI